MSSSLFVVYSSPKSRMAKYSPTTNPTSPWRASRPILLEKSPSSARLLDILKWKIRHVFGAVEFLPKVLQPKESLLDSKKKLRHGCLARQSAGNRSVLRSLSFQIAAASSEQRVLRQPAIEE
jgi:hypothetical protein